MSKEKLDTKTLINAIEAQKIGVETALEKVTVQFLEELKQYRELEEQGLLLRLPVAVEDMVWIVGNTYICDYEVRRFILSEEVEAVQVAKNIKGHDYWNSFSLEDIGKTVFLTQSGAEEKLRELERKYNGKGQNV